MSLESIVKAIPLILMGLLGFGVLVIWHELGHFLLAKLNGVKVEEFSVGMGKRLFGVKGKETEYNVRMLPIGGYVKMLGEEGECDDERAFANKANWRRLTIVAAGPIFNFILAIVLFGGVYSYTGTAVPNVGELVKDGVAINSGIKVGDKIIELNDKKIDTWTDFMVIMSENKGEAVDIKVNRDGEVLEFNIIPKEVEEDGVKSYKVGIGWEVIKPSFGEALKYGVLDVKSNIKQTFGFFGKAFKGQASKDDVGGPVTIIKLTGKVAKLGILPFIKFMAFISVQLAIFNILPFPALDGGWIVILILQMITGKKFNEDVVGKINYVGFMILLGLMVLVTVKDVLYPAF
ncbi:RIP metalloprotease RseP [Oceanirhabdus sp. W0125-5]|uniref:RIP metalloprotease RseP n=1 Tax=Oceanirhabdus sp. W0125-5 TaxID=2999116 RepID=UPI0022F2CAF2|nr:RIP metalloprotease RseP [Oceanirhabdus sp. W0125-5]WBW94827.1 RIP metalloprotease RseP [Oceanirhabdus sp. W0125-5]